jgi:hypothetical protein
MQLPAQEGVIKYRLDFQETATVTQNLEEVNTWRSILYGLNLIGQDPDRYEGYGFGNLSARSEQQSSQFFITATQTGHLPELQARHYSCVEYCDVASNHVVASGPLPPSSEALTHSMIYQLSDAIQCVIHVHDPRLWKFGLQQGMSATAESVEYGTPQMAQEVLRLYRKGLFEHKPCLVMAGHEDGLICFGNSIHQAGLALIDLWVAAQP